MDRGMRALSAIAFAAFAAAVISAPVPPPGAIEELPPPLRHLPYPQGHVLALQICLDRRGFSPNTIDGQYGRKSQVAMATYCASKGFSEPDHTLNAKFWNVYFPGESNLFVSAVITQNDHASLVSIPRDPAEKARLASMGYETLQEMFAERGHLSQTAVKRLNPHLQWPNPPVGSVVTYPDFSGPFPWTGETHGRKTPFALAASLRVSIERYEITVFDGKGGLLALFPCSIAADKAKLPPTGELQVKSVIPRPNYTYTPDYTPPGRKVERHIFHPGPNNPVGVAWIGLTLKGYGIHGTPVPERIGRAESHGCFRLANWNAERLAGMCDPGVPVVVE